MAGYDPEVNASDVTYDDFVPRLVTAVPELSDELEEHLETFHEVLTHIFMGQVASFVAEALSGNDDDAAVARRILEFLEGAMASPDGKVPEAIAVSFLETVESEGDADAVEDLLGPRLRQALEEIRTG